MEFQQQATIFDYMEATADPRCSPPTAARLPEFSPTVASMGPYSTHVLYYPPPPEATYSLPQQQQQQHQQAEPYYYYYPAGHASRQSPDLLSAKLSPPPTGLSMPPPPMCYGPYSPPCCCCAQLHYQHLQPRCSPDHLMFPQQQQQQLPAAPVSEYIPALVPTLLQAQPPPPPPLQLHLATPMEKVAARATAEPGPNRQAARGGDNATRRRPPVLTEPQASGSWIQQDLQQRRRGGYMHNILYKTELCRDMQDRGACPRGRACQFAHSPLELQDPRRHPLYKTAFCYDFKNKGHCPRGERCFHVHEIAELREATALLPHVSVPSASGSARGGSSGGRGNSRHRRSPAAAGGSGWAAGPSRPLLYDSSELGPLAVNGGSGRRAGKDAKPATTETSYRFLMRKLSSSKSSPGSTGRGPSVASIVGMDQASLEAKTRLIGLGVDGAERRILESAPRNAQ